MGTHVFGPAQAMEEERDVRKRTPGDENNDVTNKSAATADQCCRRLAAQMCLFGKQAHFGRCRMFMKSVHAVF